MATPVHPTLVDRTPSATCQVDDPSVPAFPVTGETLSLTVREESVKVSRKIIQTVMIPNMI